MCNCLDGATGDFHELVVEIKFEFDEQCILKMGENWDFGYTGLA